MINSLLLMLPEVKLQRFLDGQGATSVLCHKVHVCHTRFSIFNSGNPAEEAEILELSLIGVCIFTHNVVHVVRNLLPGSLNQGERRKAR